LGGLCVVLDGEEVTTQHESKGKKKKKKKKKKQKKKKKRKKKKKKKKKKQQKKNKKPSTTTIAKVKTLTSRGSTGRAGALRTKIHERLNDLGKAGRFEKQSERVQNTFKL